MRFMLMLGIHKLDDTVIGHNIKVNRGCDIAWTQNTTVRIFWHLRVHVLYDFT